MALETSRSEQRRYKRIQLSVPAKFLAENGTEHAAQLLDISAGGLALSAEEQPEIGVSIVVYVDELGRIEGHVVRHLEGGFAVEFDATDAKRERLAVRLTWLANRSDTTAQDKPPSSIATASEKPRFILEDGREIKCRVLDMSVYGVWLQVGARPSIGAEVTIGRMRGRIARHHATGIEIQFLR